MADWETVDEPKAVDEWEDAPDESKWSDVTHVEESMDKDVVDNLPDSLKFAVWDTGLEIPKELSAGLVGAGDMMLDTYHGVKQMLGMDLESMKKDQAIMNDLYDSDVGGYAVGGAVVGALAEPIGFLIPAGKTASLGKAVAKGAGIGAGFAAAGYVDEERGQTRLGNIAIGATLGGAISGTISAVSRKIATKKVIKANQVVDDFEYQWAKKVSDGVDPMTVKKELLLENPGIVSELKDATEKIGRRPHLSMGADEASDIVTYKTSLIKQNDLSLNMDKIAGIMSTRVRNISEPIFGRLREYDRGVMQKTHDLLNESHSFLKGYNKISGKDRSIIDKALLNGDIDTVKPILQRHGGDELLAEYKKITGMLDGLGDELYESGRISSKLDNYFPRYVKDKEGLFAAIGKVEKSRAEEQLAKARSKFGELTPLQESDIINKAIRGYPIKEGKAGFTQRRGIETVDDKLLGFYASPEESLHTYIRNAVTDLEKSKFFGKDIKFKTMGGNSEFDIDSSVGNAVRRELDDGRIGTAQLNELEHLLGVRFGIGEKSPKGITQLTKNIMYSGLLGNPISAATQLGDLGVSIYVNGFRNTLKVLPRALVGKSKVSATDFGLIDNMAEEFATTTKSAKALRAFFKYSGFKKIDKLGKESLLNGSLLKYQKLAKSDKGRLKIAQKYRNVFGDEYEQLVNDLNNKEVTENVKMLLFNELADVQPITLSEVPEMYLRMPNGRITYMLKTFMLKQFDVLRRDAYQQIKAGNKAEGLKNLMKYGIVIGSTNTGSQYIKDWMLGKDVEPDLPTDIGENLFKTFGYSEYLLNKVKEGKLAEATGDVILPPFKMFDKILQADAKAIQYMPLGGKLWYYWYGGGLEDFEQKKRDKEYKELHEQ